MKIAVIGAGLAGLTAARVLHDGSARVTVFDKSKGTGGRLSSRSFEQGWIDHGAPYISGTSDEFVSFLQRHLAEDILQSWPASVSGLPRPDEQVDYIGVPRNSAITRALLGDLTFQPSTRIARLAASEQGWQLYNDGESLLGTWPLVIVATPAPQALALVRQISILAEPLSGVVMEPCWVAAIRSRSALPWLADVHFCQHPAIHRVIHNSAKPGRRNEHVYLVQANRDWSMSHLEAAPEQIGQQLQKQFNALFPARVESELLFTHRWRYALTEKPLGEPFLWDAGLRLGICGDWCLGRTATDAWQSGRRLAETIRSSLPTAERGK